MRKRKHRGMQPLLRLGEFKSKILLSFRRLSFRKRVACGAIAGVLVLTAIAPAINSMIEHRRYTLDTSTEKLVGTVNKNLSAKLRYDVENKQWQFNQDSAESDTQGTPDLPPALTAQAGGGGKDDDSLYRTTFPENPEDGVVFTDTQTDLSFTMTPEFHLYTARASDGRIIYPMKNGAKLIYSAKNNGMKEDIVLPKFIGKELSYSYKLNLPKTLSAKIQSDGSVGIFSADPILFGNVSTSSDMDAEKLKSAQENGEKTHLLFAIPAPVIVQSGDEPVKATAKFGLNGDVLTVTARDMDKVTYPASVDPSIVVTSSSDFATGWDDGSIYYSTDQINRATNSGGSFGSWTATGDGTYAAKGFGGAVIYNGYIYNIGSNTGTTSAHYAPINSSTGAIGTWVPTTPLPDDTRYIGLGIFGGYLYVYGGYLNGTQAVTGIVRSAPINNTSGSLGSWTTLSNSMATAVCRAGTAQFGNYIYAVGGSTTPASNCGNSSSGHLAITQYAQLLPNGEISSWTTSGNNFTNARHSPGSVAYNGYLYMITGTTNGITTYDDVQYAKIDTATGAIGAWRYASNSFGGGNYRGTPFVYKGYIYYIGGTNGGTLARYAPIYANGDIGPMQTTTTLPSERYSAAVTGYKDKIYFMSGLTTGTSYQNDAWMTTLDPPGIASTSTSSTAMGTGVDAGTGGCGFMYNSYLYYIGGYNGTAYSSQARYASVSSTGTVGTWATTSALQAPVSGGVGLGGGACAVSNNRIYMIGGTTLVAGVTTSVASIQYASFNSNGTLSTWTLNTSDYVNAFTNQTAVAYNGQIYVVGLSGGGASNRIHRAPVNSDGTLGSWIWDGNGSNNLITSTSSAGMVVHNKFIYLLGGYSSPNYLDTVQYAAINSDGSLGTWATTNSLPVVRNTLAVTVLNGYMYAIGGETTGGSYSNAVDFAKINTDGTLGSWQSSANLGVTYSNGGVATWNDRIYLISGRNNGTRVKNVLYITIRSSGGGLNGSWTTSGNTFSTGRQSHGSAIFGGRLYVVGGIDSGSTRTNSVQYATLGDDGSVGSWNSTTSLPVTKAGMGVVAYAGYLYSFGGKTSSVSVSDTVHSAPINSNGTIGSWTAITSLPDQISSMSVAMRNGYVYLLGGIKSTPFNTVYYAQVNGNGTTGAWNATTSFTTARSNAGAVTNGNYLYILGGVDGSSNYLRDVQYAPINSDGTIGAWSYTTEMNYGRGYISPTVLNGFLYIYGGFDGTNSYNKVDYAPFNANGTIGAWTAGTSFTTSRYGQQVDTNNGYVYLTGGYSGTYQNTVQYSALQSSPRTASYARLFDLGALYNLTTITYGGSLPGGTDAIIYRTAGADGVFGSTARASSLSGATGVCTPGSVRYVYVMLTMDDATRSTLADENSAESYVSHLSVNYNQPHAPTESRLAHGKHFQDEVLQPLDTCSG